MQARQENGVYGLRIATVNYAQFCICRFCLDIFYSKDAPQAGMPDVDKITEIVELDWHVCSRNIVQKPKIDHKTVLNHLYKVEFKKELKVLMLHQLTKSIMNRISI